MEHPDFPPGTAITTGLRLAYTVSDAQACAWFPDEKPYLVRKRGYWILLERADKSGFRLTYVTKGAIDNWHFGAPPDFVSVI